MKVENVVKNQTFVHDGNTSYFQSYETLVCKITKNDGCEPVVEITDGQPQSKTTAKWLNEFLKRTIGINNYKQLKK